MANEVSTLGLEPTSAQALAAGPNLEVFSPSSEVSNTLQNRMVFSTFKEQPRAEKDLTLRNTGSQALTITALAFGDSQEKFNAVRPADHERDEDFKSTANLPITIAPGGSYSLPVRFLPQRTATLSASGVTHTLNGENYASLTISSNDPDQPTKTVDLAGLNADNVTGRFEPSVAEIVRSFGFGTNVGTENQRMGGTKTLLGDEVYSPYWVRANASAPVELFPIAVYSSPDTIPHDGVEFVPKGSSSGNFLYALPGGEDRGGGENQKLLPANILVGGKIVAPTSNNVDFNPSGPFALKRGPGSTDDSKNIINGITTHEWRIYTARDENGAIIPNTWIAASDTGINPQKNFDYNDNVYLLTNAKPESPALDPAVGGLVPGSPDLIFNFNKTYQGSLTDKDGQTIGFTSTQLNKNDGYTSTASYQKSLLDINPTASTLKVTSTAGINSSDNNLVNGLQTKFDGRAGKAVINTKLLGSLSYLNAGAEQAGVMFGYDQNNYVKLVARNLNGGVGVEFLFENNGVSDRIGEIVPIANASTLQSLDLKLFTDPVAGTIRAGFEVVDAAGNSTLVNMPSFISLKDKGSEFGHFFAAQSKAGLITSHKGGALFTATVDDFAVKSNETTAARAPIYRLDVAGTPYTDASGSWSSDEGLFTSSPGPATAENAGGTPNILNTTNDRLYWTYRAKTGLESSPIESRLISYNLPVSGKVDVRLHFAEVNFTGTPNQGPAGIGRRIFDVAIEGKTVLDNFDITAAAGGALTAVVVPLEGIQVTGGTLNINFRSEVNFGAINGIEVLRSAA